MGQIDFWANDGELLIDLVDLIVEGFRKKFGYRAAEAAAEQISGAAPETASVWREVLLRLSAQHEGNGQVAYQ